MTRAWRAPPRPTAAAGGEGAISATHAYAESGSYTISATATDKDGASSAAATTTATIADVAPTVSLNAVTGNEGQQVTLTGSVSDVAADLSAGESVTINWGDTTSSTVTAGANGAISAKHTSD